MTTNIEVRCSTTTTSCSCCFLLQVFVAGATGETGCRVVRELLSAGFSVRAGVRDAEGAALSHSLWFDSVLVAYLL